jgi:hypothetical protein
MPQPFATTDDLSAYLVAIGQPALTAAQLPGAQLLLAAASAAVRRETKQLITACTITAEIQGHRLDAQERLELAESYADGAAGGSWYGGYYQSCRQPVRRDLLLPQQPVRAVQAVAVNGTAVTDWELHGGALWRRDGWPGWITVTWTAGLSETPDDVKGWVLMSSAEALRGAVPVLTEQIVEYAYTRGVGLPGDHLGYGMAALCEAYKIDADIVVRSARY